MLCYQGNEFLLVAKQSSTHEDSRASCLTLNTPQAPRLMTVSTFNMNTYGHWCFLNLKQKMDNLTKLEGQTHTQVPLCVINKVT